MRYLSNIPEIYHECVKHNITSDNRVPISTDNHFVYAFSIIMQFIWWNWYKQHFFRNQGSWYIPGIYQRYLCKWNIPEIYQTYLRSNLVWGFQMVRACQRLPGPMLQGSTSTVRCSSQKRPLHTIKSRVLATFIIWNPHTNLDLRYVWYISGIFHFQRYLWYIPGIYHDRRFRKKCCLYEFHQLNCFIMLKAYTKWLSVEMGNLLSEVMLCLTHSWDISGILLRYII